MAKRVLAHITGTVWKIEVTTGTDVKEGDVLVILESMKMEMPLEAPEDGRVIELHVTEGQAITEGALVVVLE